MREPVPAAPLLPGIGIGGYRSFHDLQYLAPLQKVTLIAGQNNTGKSNVIRFLDGHLRAPGETNWSDEPRGGAAAPLTLATGHVLSDAYEEWVGPRKADNRARQSIDALLSLPALHPTGDPTLHFVRRVKSAERRRNEWVVDPALLDELIQECPSAGINPGVIKSGQLFGGHSGGSPQSQVEAALAKALPWSATAAPPVQVIHAYRQVTALDSPDTVDHSGGNLIFRLADHQHPQEQDYDIKRAKFKAIVEFVRNVVDDHSITIEIPATHDRILVRQHGVALPLESLGTGIAQVIVLASAATLLDNTLVCIEEPEVNLHPTLQRKLVRYLAERTSNQYIVATHSAHMLDYERAAVIHVRHEPGTGTVPSAASKTADFAGVCADLGYKPSDLLQSNAILWVEGPSDRIYLRHWLKLLDPNEDLIEGIHYSIMFYGGRLLSHLTATDPDDDPEVQEFISLRRINRFSAILIDSDKTKPQAKINATKQRIRQEFNDPAAPGLAWITRGYTIENLLPETLLRKTFARVHPHLTQDWDGSTWTDPLKAKSAGGKSAKADKVRIAHELVGSWSPGLALADDVRRHGTQMLDLVRAANG